MEGHKERVAVITGAAGGLGRVFANALAAEGADVAIADIQDASHVAAEVEAKGQRGYSEICDLSEPEQVEHFIANVLAKFGRVDILINNAAYMPVTPLAELTIEKLRLFERVNVEAPFMLIKGFAEGMRERQYGRIVNIISSTTGTPMPGFTGYTTTKLALTGLTRSMAAELSNDGIRVNGLSPGLTRTEESEKNLPPELFEAVKGIQIIKQTEEPQDLVGAMLFLSSEQCGFVSGQVINCDGGVNF